MRVPLAVPNLDGREAEYLQQCIDTTFVSTAGPFVSRFEQLIAESSGCQHAAVTCSGTVALQMALEALGIGAGHLVMVPSLTFIASPNSIRHSGADVWLVDVTDSTWTLDIDVARAAIERETEAHPLGRRHLRSGLVLRAIMPVMIMGASIDVEGYVALAREFGLRVVVDAAAAVGATSVAGSALAAAGADAVCFSFNGNKTVTSGGGGAVASADAELIDRVRHVTTTGRSGPDYEHDVVAYNFRMTNVEAAIGVAQMERLPTLLERKREVFERYVELASRYADLSPFPTPATGDSTHWFSGIYYLGADDGACAAFRQHMVERDIDVRPFWMPVHLQLPYRRSSATAMPVSEHVWERIVPLPCSTGISEDDLEYVVACADEFWHTRTATSGDV